MTLELSRKEFIELAIDWVEYELNLMELEKRGIEFPSKHPLWETSREINIILADAVDVPQTTFADCVAKEFYYSSKQPTRDDIRSFMTIFAVRIPE